MSTQHKCNIVLSGFFILSLLCFSGCFPDSTKGCPEEMLLSFYLEDQFEDGDFDSRIANDVLLGVFKDDELFSTYEIPYEEVLSGKQFALDKTGGIAGKLQLVAWTVSRYIDADDYVPEWSDDKTPAEMTISLKPVSKSTTRYAPVTTRHFIGSISSFEEIDEATAHEIILNVTACRIEVNVTDLGDTFETAGNVFVEVNGTMDQMTIQRQATGIPAIVEAGLHRDEESNSLWTTGRFGVLPSGEGQTVSVKIYSDEELIETLSVPQSSLPRGAESGGLLVFEYTLGQAHYFLTIDGYTKKIVIVDEM